MRKALILAATLGTVVVSGTALADGTDRHFGNDSYRSGHDQSSGRDANQGHDGEQTKWGSGSPDQNGGGSQDHGTGAGAGKIQWGDGSQHQANAADDGKWRDPDQDWLRHHDGYWRLHDLRDWFRWHQWDWAHHCHNGQTVTSTTTTTRTTATTTAFKGPNTKDHSVDLEDTGTVASIDGNANAITLADGRSFDLPSGFQTSSLTIGEKVSVFFVADSKDGTVAVTAVVPV